MVGRGAASQVMVIQRRGVYVSSLVVDVFIVEGLATPLVDDLSSVGNGCKLYRFCTCCSLTHRTPLGVAGCDGGRAWIYFPSQLSR